MANPQKEQGYVPIANSLLEAILRFPLSDSAHRVFLAIIRKTYGYQKKTDRIPASQITALTGLPNRAVQKCLALLKEKNLITRDERGMTGIVKDFDAWKLSTNDGTPAKIGSAKIGRDPLPKLAGFTPAKIGTLNRQVPKDNYQKTGGGCISLVDKPTRNAPGQSIESVREVLEKRGVLRKRDGPKP